MKDLETYIIESEINLLNEGLLAKLKNWFNKLTQTQEKLIKDNKPISLKVDTKQIKGPEKPCKLKDITSNPEEMKLIKNKQIGFPLTDNIITNAKKYLTDNENNKEFDVVVNRYFYVDGNNTYGIGYSMYDTSIQKIEGFANILDLDVLQSIENLSEVQKFIMEKVETDLKNQNIKGMIYSGGHPKLKPILIKQGFTSSKENKDWIIKNIK